ncbi:M23 family metallopeptidase [Inquilinus sp. CAU 1745]|uniref:M23 family metallopeptidase n=1 Tax=Inquilinus sp. CAU 1745 TaxID=3140369 RepID=UPI00325BAFA5
MHLKLAAYPVLVLTMAGVVGLAVETDLFSPTPSIASDTGADPLTTARSAADAGTMTAPARNDIQLSILPIEPGAFGPRPIVAPPVTAMAPSGPEEHVLTVASGDTLMGMLTDVDLSAVDAATAIEALEEVYDPRDLQIDQEINVTIDHTPDGPVLASLELMPDVERRLRIERTDEGFSVAEIANELETRWSAATGVIDSSLYGATNGAGVPDQVLIDLIRILSYKVDFQRDIQPGDAFEILYEQDYDENGNLARNGNVLYATLLMSGHEMPVYRFETEDGVVDYYSRDGESVRRLLMRTPIDGARISSNFGMRHHPVLGYSRMHKGTDFAAPRGTPIYAAGDGVIDFIGTNSGYGNYIRIRHTGSIKTAYAHMRGFADGLSDGERVTQGQTIGYVGTSGLSTGPHLHYEVLQNGSQINPMDLDLPTGRTLEGTELARFQDHMEEIDARFIELMSAGQVAARP